MADTYDPLTSAFPVDATIGSGTYIVTAFNDAGHGANKVAFSTSAGAFRGRRLTKGERVATMTIESENAAQAAPEQFATFTYDGSVWVIETNPKSTSSTAPASWSLTLGWISAAA